MLCTLLHSVTSPHLPLQPMFACMQSLSALALCHNKSLIFVLSAHFKESSFTSIMSPKDILGDSPSVAMPAAANETRVPAASLDGQISAKSNTAAIHLVESLLNNVMASLQQQEPLCIVLRTKRQAPLSPTSPANALNSGLSADQCTRVSFPGKTNAEARRCSRSSLAVDLASCQPSSSPSWTCSTRP